MSGKLSRSEIGKMGAERVKELRKNPEFVKMISEKNRQTALRQWANPEIRQKMKDRMKEVRRLDPTINQRSQNNRNTSEINSRSAFTRWSNPKFKEERSKLKKQWWNDLTEERKLEIKNKMSLNRMGIPSYNKKEKVELVCNCCNKHYFIRSCVSGLSKFCSIGCKNKTTAINNWKNEDYRKKILASREVRPTGLESNFIQIIAKYNLPYKYVGDGSFIIGYKIPDFVHAEKKICLEVRPRDMCQYWNKMSPEQYEQKRKSHFAKYGYECIVIFSDKRNNFELSDEEIIKRINL